VLHQRLVVFLSGPSYHFPVAQAQLRCCRPSRTNFHRNSGASFEGLGDVRDTGSTWRFRGARFCDALASNIFWGLSSRTSDDDVLLMMLAWDSKTMTLV
jgi:hypothetical protein